MCSTLQIVPFVAIALRRSRVWFPLRTIFGEASLGTKRLGEQEGSGRSAR